MVYLDGDNNLEGAGVIDLNEMELVGSTADVNVLVQFDRIGSYDSSNGNWTDTRRGRVVQDANTSLIGTPLTSIGEVNMGDPAVLTAFVQWGIATYPADRYAVILWDHGGGTSGVCWDDTNGADHLTVAEVGVALAAVGTHLDLVGFDACLMAMTEQAYEIRLDADVMVASEQTEPWGGWPYDTFLADLVAVPTQTAVTLATSIVTRYGESYGGAETQSAVTLSGVQSLATALDNFVGTVIAEDTDWGVISAARSGADYFTDTDYRDLGTFIDGVVSGATNANILSAAQAVQTAYASAVVANHSSASDGGTGLSIYLPPQGGYVSSSYTPGRFELLTDTQWDEFLGVFTGSSGGGGGTDVDGCLADATTVSALPATITANVGLDGVESVGGLDVDFYALAVTAGDRIGFDIDALETGGSLESVLRLFDASGAHLGHSDDGYDPDTGVYSWDPYLEHTFTKTETVTIAVSGYDNSWYNPFTSGSGTSGDTGDYTLLIRTLGAVTGDDNGTIPTATVLGSAPLSYVAEIGDEDIGTSDVDLYAVQVESNQILTITVTAAGGLDGYLRLFKSDGTVLAEDDDTDGTNPRIDYNFSSVGSGTYYVGVSGWSNTSYNPFVLGTAVPGSTGVYTLQVAGYSVDLDFDGTILLAGYLGSAPADVYEAIGDEPSGALDVDFYAVDVTAGQILAFDIDAAELGYGLDAVLRLFDAAGVELAFSDDDYDPDSGSWDDPYIERVFPLGGTYTIAVSGWPNDGYEPFVETSGLPGDVGDYELHVLDVGGVGGDPDGTIPTARFISYLPCTLVGEIGDGGADDLDVDFYAFLVTAGQTVEFDVDAEETGSWLDSMLRLFDGSGTELASNDDAYDPDTGQYTYDSYISYTFATAGTYTIAVSGYSNDDYDPFVPQSGWWGGDTGEYTLTVSPPGIEQPSASEYMTSLCWGVLRRAPGAGITQYVAVIESGDVSREAVARSFLNSAEFQTWVAPVVRLYRAYLGRCPDGGGLTYWVNRRKAGMLLPDVAKGFTQAPEFINRHGDVYNTLSNEAFVTWAYETVLGRTPAAFEINFWRPALDNGWLSREQVMIGFTESTEYVLRTRNTVNVTQLYLGILERPAGNSEINYWVGRLVAGSTLPDVVNRFLNSPEYQNLIRSPGGREPTGMRPADRTPGPDGEIPQTGGYLRRKPGNVGLRPHLPQRTPFRRRPGVLDGQLLREDLHEDLLKT